MKTQHTGKTFEMIDYSEYTGLHRKIIHQMLLRLRGGSLRLAVASLRQRHVC